MTYKELYEWGVTKLTASEVEEAKLDARLLLEDVCNTSRSELLIYPEKEVACAKEEQYKEYIARRGQRIPLAYIIKKQAFMGLSFVVNEQVLIPRQDTEILVEEAMLVTHDGMRILDICTGSGCILLSLMHYKNDCEGVGVDISKKALRVAKKNAKNLKLNAQFLESDLLESVSGKFDIVLSNPPYIESAVIDTLMPEVKEKEPMIALDGGADGLYFYREIIKQIKPFLKNGSIVLFEIGYNQSKSVEEIMQSATGFKEIKTIKDFAGLDRVVTGTFLEEICLIN